MFEGLFQPMHLLIIAGIALLVFGPRKLPELGMGLGDGFEALQGSDVAKTNQPASRSTYIKEAGFRSPKWRTELRK